MAKRAVRRRSKYGAVRTQVAGIRFDSKAEAGRYVYLLALTKAGKIHDLTLQPEFILDVDGATPIGKYRGDFRYCACDTPLDCQGVYRVEDVKGFKTPLYRWKKKHVEAQYGIKVTEV